MISILTAFANPFYKTRSKFLFRPPPRTLTFMWMHGGWGECPSVDDPPIDTCAKGWSYTAAELTLTKKILKHVIK